MPDRFDHAQGAGAAGSGEDSSRNAVSAASSSQSAIPQAADYADYGMERSVLACILADPDCINTVSTMLGVRLPPAAQGKSVDSDGQFVKRLLTAAFGRFAEYYDKVAGSVRGWDRDRLFTTDIVLIAMGLAEAETFPEIPVKVTINEYVEISKFYSTPKSRSFVNGILDRLIKESEAEGRIHKTGKGLL